MASYDPGGIEGASTTSCQGDKDAVADIKKIEIDTKAMEIASI